MATNNVHVPDDLLAQMQTAAHGQGKTVDELAEEALRAHLDDRKWQDLLAYGRQRGLESGYTEADIPDLVKDYRREQKLSPAVAVTCYIRKKGWSLPCRVRPVRMCRSER